MAGFTEMREKWNMFWDGVRTTMAPVDNVLGKIGSVIGFIGRWIYRLRGLLISIPVAIAAWKLAAYNKLNLPAEVGIDLLSTGEFGTMVSLQYAVMVPLCLTGISLVMVLCTRKPLIPWVISIFTLTLPLLLLMNNNLTALIDLLTVWVGYFSVS